MQAAVSGDELLSGIAFVILAQALGPTVALTACNIVFDRSLLSQIAEHAPQADAVSIVSAGSTGFRSLATPSDIPGLLVAYTNSLTRVFYLVAALAATCGIFLWGIGWHDLQKKTEDVWWKWWSDIIRFPKLSCKRTCYLLYWYGNYGGEIMSKQALSNATRLESTHDNISSLLQFLYR